MDGGGGEEGEGVFIVLVVMGSFFGGMVRRVVGESGCLGDGWVGMRKEEERRGEERRGEERRGDV